MGRTLLPYSMQIELVNERFREFRRGLRKEDREIFDELMRSARRELQAGVMAAHPNPFDAMAMSMLMELLRHCRKLDRRLTVLEELKPKRQQERERN